MIFTYNFHFYIFYLFISVFYILSLEIFNKINIFSAGHRDGKAKNVLRENLMEICVVV